MTPSYFRVGGFFQDVPDTFVPAVRSFWPNSAALSEYQAAHEERIWMKRTVGVGTMSAEDAIDLELHRVPLRGNGVVDVRKTMPYLGYETYEFEVPVGKNGDVYDRYLCHIEEMKLSRWGSSSRARPLAGPVRAANKYLFPADPKEVKLGMEEP